jgi:hypothetical protein
MSEVPTRVEINCETGEQTIIPLTAEEVAQMEADRLALQAALDARALEEMSLAEAKASGIAKLLALGLTEEEANALIK